MTRSEALRTLEIPESVSPSPEEIKSAWREQTRKHHPDLHPDDPSKEETFKRISAAYEILTGQREADPEPSSGSSSRPSGPSVDLSGLFSAVLNRVAQPVHRATLVDLLGEDAAVALQAGARAFAAAASKKGK
jgi:hypothetical protein